MADEKKFTRLAGGRSGTPIEDVEKRRMEDEVLAGEVARFTRNLEEQEGIIGQIVGRLDDVRRKKLAQFCQALDAEVAAILHPDSGRSPRSIRSARDISRQINTQGLIRGAAATRFAEAATIAAQCRYMISFANDPANREEVLELANPANHAAIIDNIHENLIRELNALPPQIRVKAEEQFDLGRFQEYLDTVDDADLNTQQFLHHRVPAYFNAIAARLQEEHPRYRGPLKSIAERSALLAQIALTEGQYKPDLKLLDDREPPSHGR
ncbi:MAG: hypothetical protein AB7L92_02235 [Alphaproteobacteria bacterium]